MFMNRLPQRQRRMMPMRPIRQPAMMPGSYQLDEPYQGDQCFPPVRGIVNCSSCLFDTCTAS